MTSPTPIDGLVWSYHCLGWSTRRIAGEVQTSQATVVRILDRLRKDPPAENTVIMNTTPPSGLPALVNAYPDDEPILPRGSRFPGVMIVVTLLLIGALAATLAAASGGLIARGKPGPSGPPGPRGPAGQTGEFTFCVRFSAVTGDVTSITAPVRGGCGTATLIRLP